MPNINIYPMHDSTVLRISAERNLIDSNVLYHKKGGVWNLGEKAAFNRFDLKRLRYP